MKSHRSPRWIDLAQKVITSAANEQRSTRSNATMLGVMTGVIRTLQSGVELSPKQQDAFLENIRRRVPGQHELTWTKPIRLTKEQLRHAKRVGINVPGFTPDQPMEGVKVGHYNTDFTPVSHLFPTTFTPLSHHFHTCFTPEDPSTPSAVSGCGALTERNETKLNLTLVSDHSLPARDPNQELEMIIGAGSSTNEEENHLGETQGVHINTADTWTEEERLAARAAALQGLMERGDKAVQRETGTKPQGPLRGSVKLGEGATLDVWSDSETFCQAVLSFAGAKFYLNFVGLLGAEERLFQARNEPGDYSFCRMVSDGIVVPLRDADVRRDDPEHRFKASPVYKSRHYDTGIYSQMFVVLGWQGRMLKNAMIVNGPDEFFVKLNPNTSTKPKAPDYKGVAKPAGAA